MTTRQLNTEIHGIPSDFFDAIGKNRAESEAFILKEFNLGHLTLEAQFNKWIDSTYEISKLGMLIFDNEKSMYALNLDYVLERRGMQRYYETKVMSWVVTDGINLYPFCLPVEAFKPMDDLIAEVVNSFS